MSLVTGTTTFALAPASNESFFLETPTDRIELKASDNFFMRMDSFLDGTALTPQGEKGESMVREGLLNSQIAKGQTLFFFGGEVVPLAGTSHPVLAEDWDSWVYAQVQDGRAATTAALKASGFSSSAGGGRPH
jgi:hypothetical protein